MNSNLKKLVVFFAVFLSASYFIFLFDSYLYDFTQKQIDHYQHRVFKDSYRSGIMGFFKFDEADVSELMWGKKCNNYGTVLKDGKINKGRYFNGSNETYIDTQIYWESLKEQYTISCWVKLEKEETQSIIFICQGKLGSGIILHKGAMLFQVPSKKANQTCAYEFLKFGEFVHLTGVADLKSGKAYLYENGELKSSISIEDIEHTSYPIQFGKYRPLKVYYPLHGILDETIIWRKALNQKEILKIYTSKASYWNKISFKYLVKLNLFKKLNRFFQIIAISFDILNPFYHEAKISNLDIPQFNFIFSKSDIKYLNQYQNSTLEKGYLDWEDVNDKKAKLIWKNQAIPITFKYYGKDSRYWQSPKKSFYIEIQSDKYPLKMKRILFTTPEIKGFLKPCLWKILSNRYESKDIKNGYAIVRINSKYEGVFYFEEYFVDGYRDYKEELSIKDIISKLEYSKKEVLSIYSILKKRYLPIFLNDKTISLSKQEIRYLINQNESQIKKYFKNSKKSNQKILENVYNYISYKKILGDNCSNDYVTTDLNLNFLKIPDVLIKWQSSNPSIISNDGKINRQTISDSENVKLQCSIFLKDISKTKTFDFQVISKKNLIPVLKIDVPSNNIENIYRTPSVVNLIDPVSMKSFGKFSSSIKLRGNTALYYDKKSYSVRTEQVHNYFDFFNTKKFNLMGVAPDQTFMHNKLTYDLFRSFGDDDNLHSAPKVHWVDLFINNEYMGLYEISEKVDISSLNMKPYASNEKSHSVIYKALGSNANFKTPLKGNYIHKYPKNKHQEYWQPFMDLINFIGSSSKKDFVKNISKKMDLNNIMDFHIIVNLSYSTDGIKHNLFLCRNNDKNDPFFIIPWDYDKSYGLTPKLWISNYLFDRLKKECPGYKKMFSDRWKHLRNNQLSKKNLLKRINVMEKTLRNRVRYNFKLFKCDDYETHHLDEVKKLKKWVEERLNHMDKIIEHDFAG